MVTTALDVLQWLVEPGAGGPSSVGLGASKAIKNALIELHATEKTVENTDQLMVSFVLLFTGISWPMPQILLPSHWMSSGHACASAFYQ